MTERLPLGLFLVFHPSICKTIFFFSGLDNSKFNSKTLVTLTNINPKGFWEAPLDGISVNGVDLGLTGRTTILDTGGFFTYSPLSKVLNENTHRHDCDVGPR